MRITGGQFAGQVIKVPQLKGARPTTAMVHEALFNILQNKVDFDNTQVLDLYSGSGLFALECLSRGAGRVVCVDVNSQALQFTKSIAQKWDLGTNNEFVKYDVPKYLNKTNDSFDVVFADPPYAGANIGGLCDKIFEQNLLKPNGLLIFEHLPSLPTEHLPHFTQKRVYGGCALSFFEKV